MEDINYKLLDEIKAFALEKGVSDISFVTLEDGINGYTGAISYCIRLSKAIISEIEDAPTHTYFSHYRTVNAFIDRIGLEIGLYIQKLGYDYITIPASQSINTKDSDYEGRYSHKKAAHLSGMGGIGKSGLFIHKEFGSMVRLGTIFTNIKMPQPKTSEDVCKNCNLCVNACPAMAITGNSFDPDKGRSHIFDAKACSDYMKNNFKHIGRGVVCGICIKVCKYNR